MSMTLIDVIHILYPNANMVDEIQIGDHGDGKGQVITYWNLNGVDQPSEDQIAKWLSDPNILAQYTQKQNAIENQPIIDQLNEIDIKSIRALRTNDTTRLQTLEAQAVVLRSQLKV